MPELNWLGDHQARRSARRVAYRLLETVEQVGAADDGQRDNLLIQGDNLEALKSLLPLYAGRVKCIFIDPPYNTKSAFEHYDDNLEHSQWLSMIYPRLVLLRELLAEDGSIWVTIDDNEAHYLKVLMDEVFGRGNFVTSCTWQQRTTRENRKVFSEDCESILLYCRDPELFKAKRNDLDLTEAVKARYKNPDDDPRGPWQSVSLNAQGGHGTPSQFYEFIAPSGKVHRLPAGRCWLYTWPVMQEKIADSRVWFGAEGNNAPREKKFLSEAKAGLTPNTLWLAADVGTNDEAKKETVTLFGEDVFETPKPERLIQRILHIATNANDLVLDSFLGSGTTAAVAHKMG
ncbi:MAG TPA: site-specific DNA-methyltransferase, partial [Gammaproteobacteria bacterium]|nr:site-specific DNA-methyltransferase [Gammaproteobacteria bacterium]